jgi:transposase
MIQITPQLRILVAVEAIDARKGIDSLAQLCREKLAADPFSGCVFIFRSRRGTAIKILAYDGQGFWLATKRLSKGRFRWWPTGTEPTQKLRAHQGAPAAGRRQSRRGSAPGVAAAERLKDSSTKVLRSVLDSATLSPDVTRLPLPRPSHYGGRHRLYSAVDR